MTRPFRFGVVAPLMTDLPTWRDRVRRIADSGYSTLLMPDVPHWQPAPGPTLAFAAAQADLHVGTWVYACPLRPAWGTAWEAHSVGARRRSLRDGHRHRPARDRGRTPRARDAPWSHRGSGWPRCVRP